jgi:hypothetical protein
MHKLLFFFYLSSRFLRPLKPCLIFLTLFALLLTTYCLIASSDLALDLLEPAIVVSLWGMLLLASTELFHNQPLTYTPEKTFWQRLIIRAKLLIAYFMALLTLVVFAALIWLSLRLLLI